MREPLCQFFETVKTVPPPVNSAVKPRSAKYPAMNPQQRVILLVEREILTSAAVMKVYMIREMLCARLFQLQDLGVLKSIAHLFSSLYPSQPLRYRFTSLM